MNIGVVVDNELNNDVRVLREIAILREQGFDIFVLCYGFRKIYETPIDKIKITRFNIHRKLRDVLFFILNTIPVYEWLWASKIKRFISSNEIEVLHVHDLYMSRAADSGIKKSAIKIPMILDLHENYPFAVTTYNWTKGFFRNLISKPGKWQKKEKEYLGYADKIIVLSNDYKYNLISIYPELSENIFTVLPNVPDLSQLGQQIKIPVNNPFNQGYPIIFYYGGIAERRGIFDALDIFSDLVNENKKINFLLIGPADKKDKQKFLKHINLKLLANRIHYIPWIESKELPAYLELVDICIAPFHKNPQHESGVANKIFEYMLGGKPLVVSNCLPQQSLVEKHNCGFVFRNMTEFHNAIIKLAGDRCLRVRLGKNGFDAIMKEHNMGLVKEELIQLYKSISKNMKQSNFL